MYMITSDTNLDLTCGATWLTYNDLTGCYGWTIHPAGATLFTRLRYAEDTVRLARVGELCSGGTPSGDCIRLQACPGAEVIPAMEQNADGEWSDGSWEHAADLEAALPLPTQGGV